MAIEQTADTLQERIKAKEKELNNWNLKMRQPGADFNAMYEHRRQLERELKELETQFSTLSKF